MSFVALDCEGPITLNDNAFELAKEFIPNGDSFFSNVSKYDDFLADVLKRPGYKAGDTLKLILPFFKAYEITNEHMKNFSEKTLAFVPDASDMLRELNSMVPSFIISTSYKPYLEALSNETGFPLEHIYCTEVDIDAYDISENDAKNLRDMAQEIANMPQLTWPDDAKRADDLGKEDQAIFRRLEEIFWAHIPSMEIGKIFKDVNPIGGPEKASGVEDASRRTQTSIQDSLYGGDSITDVEAFRLVREHNGITISFNGNSYAVKAAEFALISPSSLALHAIIKAFVKQGADSVRSAFHEAKDGLSGTNLLNRLDDLGLEKNLLDLLDKYKDQISLFYTSPENLNSIISQSEKMRKFVRGNDVGNLG
ncbi:Energy conserving hydrogenase Eha associated protein (protein R) [Dissulfuribacter thermophilus]|uniref:Energy conserving hydrogenase Eha associated protein (Protein R) n=1 Tax=Dissulfuribacter thermophilus TaxID=1156395 RepID=A0A1B9F4J3_9BACT|nr:hypothetical protein [Dissulfuribacter thermophilus]OCC14850.1 Energy conserving hydrogenase Eha associated protein (protein R) [Dissulfuribacter thermophilus]